MLWTERRVGKSLARGNEVGKRVHVDGKVLSLEGRRYTVRGVTYGTFAPRADGALFPETQQILTDLAGMRAAGFNTVRTYTSPPADLLSIAADLGLRVIAGIFYPDWRYLV